MVPSLIVSTPSHFMPAPPEPVDLSVTLPPETVMLASELIQLAPFVSPPVEREVSSDHLPSPEVVISMVPPVMLMSPSAFIPLQAMPVTFAVSVPPEI